MILDIGEIPNKVQKRYEISPYLHHSSLVDIDKKNLDQQNRIVKRTYDSEKNEESHVKLIKKVYHLERRISAQSEVFNDAQKMNFERVKRIKV